MTDFLKNPNLPEGEVTHLICGRIKKEVADYFIKRGIKLYFTEDNLLVDKAISKHCDLSALYLGEGKIIVDKGQAELINKLSSDGFDVIKSIEAVKGEYPDDVILNHAVVGDYIIGKYDSFDKSVKKNIGNMKVINTKQGYTKCSVFVADGNSVITDDVSIAKCCEKSDINCLLIEKGDVYLEGHEYGFIGGCSGKISKNEAVFFGDITSHRNYYEIKTFLEKRDIEIISFDFPLTDFGGIVPVKEKVI